jgi:hypothetical protein
LLCRRVVAQFKVFFVKFSFFLLCRRVVAQFVRKDSLRQV